MCIDISLSIVAMSMVQGYACVVRWVLSNCINFYASGKPSQADS